MSLVEVVTSDLEWLKNEFEFGSRDRNVVRRSSAVVRRLLVEGALQQARKAVGEQGQPRLEIYPLTQLVDLSGTGSVELAVAGGCRIDRRLLGPFSVGPEAREVPNPAVVSTVSLPEFMKAPCLVAAGCPVDRRQLVKYVANKLGGVHFDSSRGRKGDEYIKSLEVLDGYLIVEPLSVVDMTMLAVIQAMLSAVDVMEPFGLNPIAMTLAVPLESALEQVEIPTRAYLKFDFMGESD